MQKQFKGYTVHDRKTSALIGYARKSPVGSGGQIKQGRADLEWTLEIGQRIDRFEALADLREEVLKIPARLCRVK